MQIIGGRYQQLLHSRFNEQRAQGKNINGGRYTEKAEKSDKMNGEKYISHSERKRQNSRFTDLIDSADCPKSANP